MKVAALAVLALVAGAALAENDVKSYAGYQLIRVEVATEDQARVLDEFQHSILLDYWTDIRIGGTVDVLVAPSKAYVKHMLDNHGFKYFTLIEDIQALIDQEADNMQKIAEAKAKQKKAVPYAMDWDNYHDINDMYEYWDFLEANFDYVTTETIGQSTLGEDLRLLKICKDGCGNKPAMWMDGGIHAREWISPATVTYQARMLTEMLTDQSLIDNLDWYLLPSANPDGYAYTQSSDRLWRKTRSQHAGEFCIGTDANRNWGFHFNDGGSSDSSCSDTYHGPYAFSEPENIAVSDYLTANKDQIKYYNSIHSYSQYILLPWGYQNTLPNDYDEMKALADLGNEALYATHQKVYEVGCIPCLLYIASGSSIDWAHGDAGIKYTYSMELRDTGLYGFLLPPEQITPTGEEIWAFHEVVAQEIISEFGAQ